MLLNGPCPCRGKEWEVHISGLLELSVLKVQMNGVYGVAGITFGRENRES